MRLRARAATRVLLFCAVAQALASCGGGGGGGGGDSPTPAEPQAPAATWERQEVGRVAVKGLTTPWVRSAPSPDGTVHLAFFEDAAGAVATYAIRHLLWDPDAIPPAALESETVLPGLDNCSGLGLAVDASGQPGVAYQGGAQRACGAERQSDAMLSIGDSAGWAERTAAIGGVDRNPVFRDGLAGADVAVAADSQGRFHVVYQFHYEGCDAMNFRYADLRYVVVDPADAAAPSEETVEGNDYVSQNRQNAVGENAAIAVDDADAPVVFYYATLEDGSRGLRVARKAGGVWAAQWVERDCEIGDISAARSPEGGVAVAYQVLRYTDGRDDDHLLRFARETGTGGAWAAQTVDDGSRCGGECSLAFTPGGQPMIAYHDLETHTGYARKDLRLARFDGTAWARETVSSAGDIGHFNNLWADGQGRAVICTYAPAERAVYLFRKTLSP